MKNNARQSRAMSYTVVKKGLSDCKHEKIKTSLSTEDGFAFANFECENCEGKLRETLGKVVTPESWVFQG